MDKDEKGKRGGWSNPNYEVTEGEEDGGRGKAENGFSGLGKAVMMEDPPVRVAGRIGKLVKSRIPILSWLPKYSLEWLVSDMIAGITVGLTVIPQGIAYAIVAGLPPQYGLYSAYLGCFVYCLLGSTKDVTIGPTAIMAIMTGEVFTGDKEPYGIYYAPLLAFFTGIIVFICGNLRLGFLIDFISQPVIAGFTSGAAITIASGQIKSLLGIAVPKEHKSHTHAGIVDYYVDIVNNIHHLKWEDAVLGVICAIILLSLRALNRTGWFESVEGQECNSNVQRFMNSRMSPRTLAVVRKIVWFICTARNALVVVTMAIVAMLITPDIHVCENNRDDCTFTLTGDIKGGIPTPALPPFSIPKHSVENGTLPPEDVSFGDMAGNLGSAFIIIPIIAILESVAIAKAFSGGKPLDASQEMIALGACNIIGSFFSSMPTTGSFSRTAVNCASGVKTQAGGLFTGALVMICLACLMEYCAFIPKAVLAAVIMTAVIFSVEHHVIHPIWDSKRIDLVPGFVCFFVALFWSLDYCIFIGTAVHMGIVMYSVARPKVQVEVVNTQGLTYLSVKPDQGIVFPSVNYIRNTITKAGVKEGQSRMPVVIDCSKISQTDFTAAEGFKAMLKDFSLRSQPVYWLTPNTEVARIIKVIVGATFKEIDSVTQIAQPEVEVLVDVAHTSQIPPPCHDNTSPVWDEGN